MDWPEILAGVIPSIGVGLVFWYAMRAVVNADRRERAALAQHEAERAERDDAIEAQTGRERPSGEGAR